MNILERHQVVCTMRFCHQKICMGNFMVAGGGGVLMVRPKKLVNIYIIVQLVLS